MLRAAPAGTHLHPSMLEEPAGSIHGALYVLDNFGRFSLEKIKIFKD
jgi:hypothetical protein